MTEQQLLADIEYQLSVQLSAWIAIANAATQADHAQHFAVIALSKIREDALKNALALTQQIAGMN
jgi:hypothetical protein